MKFKITESEKKSILDLYGLLNEQQGSETIVSGNYTATNCDELHAFQSTGGKVIGNMNVLVKNKIQELNSKGLNVKVTNVSVKVNGMTVSWSVKISPSNDNWVGFTSRGAGCNGSIEERAGNDSIGNGPQSVINAVSKQGFGEIENIEIVNDFKYNDPNGKNSFKQIFYRYKLKTDANQVGSSNIEVDANNLRDFLSNIQSETSNKRIDQNSIKVSINNDTSNYSFSVSPGQTKVKKLVLVLNTMDDHRNKVFPSKDSILSQNAGSFVSATGTFENGGNTGKRDWAIISII